jgi:hypothetical protein
MPKFEVLLRLETSYFRYVDAEDADAAFDKAKADLANGERDENASAGYCNIVGHVVGEV